MKRFSSYPSDDVRWSRRAVGLFLAAVCTLATAAPYEITVPGLVVARATFQAGLAGDGAARDKALTDFVALRAAHPGHPLLLAYQGAALALQGRDALMPWNKLKLSERGADLIEQALAMLAPVHDEVLLDGAAESVETRLVAATTLLALPDFMNRGAGGRRALQAALDAPAYASAPAPVRAGLLRAAAGVAGRDKRGADEGALLRQAVAAAPQSRDGKQAALRLRELGL